MDQSQQALKQLIWLQAQWFYANAVLSRILQNPRCKRLLSKQLLHHWKKSNQIRKCPSVSIQNSRQVPHSCDTKSSRKRDRGFSYLFDILSAIKASMFRSTRRKPFKRFIGRARWRAFSRWMIRHSRQRCSWGASWRQNCSQTTSRRCSRSTTTLS